MIFANRIVRLFFLATLAIGSACPLARAQEQPSSPQKRENNNSARPGRQLVHESREAAGEETDQTAEFKQSASVQWIARKLHLSLRNAYWLGMLLNFAAIAAAVLWAGRKYLPGIIRDRTAAIQKAMQEAQTASEEARRRLAEIESRLMKLDVEVGMMRNAAEKEAEAEETRIRAAAQQEAKKIVAAAEQEIAAAAKTARRQLTAHAADLAVGLAQKQIRVDTATDQTLVRNFAGQLGTADKPGKDSN